ncbi:MAG: hypothetical protein N3G75_09350, partial [Methanothrix sp.]
MCIRDRRYRAPDEDLRGEAPGDEGSKIQEPLYQDGVSMTRGSRAPARHSRYLEAVERCISESPRVYSVCGLQGTLFELVGGQIYRNRSDAFIKSVLSSSDTESAIRISKPQHISRGLAGSYFSDLEETSVMIQIDIISRRGDDFCDELLQIIESLFFDAIEHEMDGMLYCIDVERLEGRDAYSDPDLEASHAVLTVYGHYREFLVAEG